MRVMNKVDIHKKICEELNALYARKNADYGDSFGKSFAEYGLTMACIRLEDKLNRIKALTRKTAQVSDESIDDTLRDLANYAIMTLVEMQGGVTASADFTAQAVDRHPELPRVGDHDECCAVDCRHCICNTCRRDQSHSTDESCCQTHDRRCTDYMKPCKD